MNIPKDSSIMDDLVKIFEAKRKETEVVVVYENLDRINEIANEKHMFFVRSNQIH